MESNKSSRNTDTSMLHNAKEVVEATADAATSLRPLFINMLQTIFWAENELLQALPKMAANATTPSLKSCLVEHRLETENQVARLEKVFELMGEPAEGKKCEALTGLLKAGDAVLQKNVLGLVRDAGIIAAAQKIEHYEIAAYGTLYNFAKVLGENDAAKLLKQNLAEEKEADTLLTDVANVWVNAEAATL